MPSYIYEMVGNRVTRIGDYEAVMVFPRKHNGVVYKIIGQHACYDSLVIETIDFSNTEVTIFENSCFYGCQNLKNVMLPNTIKRIDFNVFTGAAITQFNIPASLENMTGYALNQTPNLVSFTVDSHNTHFYTEGTCLYNYNKTILYVVSRRVTSEKGIPYFNKIKEIGSCAFTFTDVTTLTVPSSVRFIDKYGFHAMFHIQFLDLSKTKIKAIEAYCFWHCTAKTVKFPNTLKTLKENAFHNYLPVDWLILPSSVIKIEDNAFYSNNGITKIWYKGCTDFAFNNIFTGTTDKSQLLIYVRLCYPSKLLGWVDVIVYEKPTIKIPRKIHILKELLFISIFLDFAF